MVFNSVGFLIFLAAVLLVDRLPFGWGIRKLNLLLASLLFYCAWYPPAVLLLLLTLSIDYAVALAVHAEPSQRRRKRLLILSLIANFGVLGFFKYAGFLWVNFTDLVHWLNWDVSGWQPSVFLPLGISFYTFQSISYVVDVYRGRVQPSRSYLDFSLYVSFFPHLVAGPIVRYADFGPQLDLPKRATGEQLAQGLLLVIFGLFLKVTLGDALFATIAEPVYAAANDPVSSFGPTIAWAGIFAFAGQLYCDFAGYSMCAVGLALCFGFHFPWNFRTPYGSTSFTEFWTRWHISLSSWIRDYIYYPLGGNRHGSARTSLNLMLAFVFSGFWHGASWTFGIWGAIHGLILVIEKTSGESALGRLAAAMPAVVKAMLVTTTFALSLTFFRAESLSAAIHLLRQAFSSDNDAYAAMLFDWQWQLSFGAMLALFAFHFAARHRGPMGVIGSLPVPLQSGLVATLLVVMLTSLPEKGHVFIYFQF